MLENWFRKSRSTQIVYETFGLYSSNSMIKLRVLQTAKEAVYTIKNYIFMNLEYALKAHIELQI